MRDITAICQDHTQSVMGISTSVSAMMRSRDTWWHLSSVRGKNSGTWRHCQISVFSELANRQRERISKWDNSSHLSAGEHWPIADNQPEMADVKSTKRCIHYWVGWYRKHNVTGVIGYPHAPWRITLHLTKVLDKLLTFWCIPEKLSFHWICWYRILILTTRWSIVNTSMRWSVVCGRCLRLYENIKNARPTECSISIM